MRLCGCMLYWTARCDGRHLNVSEWASEIRQRGYRSEYKGVAKESMNEAGSAIWRKMQRLAARFQAADLIVLGVPMWNFAYPYKLKQLIDLVCQRFTLSA